MTISQRDLFLNMVFTTAIEGGINYWARVTDYHWSKNGEETADFNAKITDVEDEGKEYLIDKSVITHGINRAYNHYKSAHKPGWDDYQWRAISDLYYGKWDDVDFDADTADLVVQFGLFGEAVYG